MRMNDKNEKTNKKMVLLMLITLILNQDVNIQTGFPLFEIK